MQIRLTTHQNQTGETESRENRIVEKCCDLALRKGKAVGETKPTESKSRERKQKKRETPKRPSRYSSTVLISELVYPLR